MQKAQMEITSSNQIPEEYINPINGKIYADPVVAIDGNLYEAEELIKWANGHNFESYTRTNVRGPLILNRDLRTRIEEFLVKYPESKAEQYVPSADFERKDNYYLGEVSQPVTTPKIEPFVINDRTPLIPQNKVNPSVNGGVVGCIGYCVSLVIGGGVSLIVYLATRSNPQNTDDTPKISFNFDVPYSSGGTLIINNQNDYEIDITDIQFTGNFHIDTTKEGVIYGDLAPWGAAKISLVSNNANTYTYKVTEPAANPVTIGPNSSKNFTYVFDKALGIVNVGTMPKNVALTTTEDSYQLDVANKCEKEACEDPFGGKVVGGYYTNWDMYDRKFAAKNIPPSKVNRVYYAFVSYDAKGNLKITDPNSDNIQLPMLMQLQQQFPYLKVAFSIGGANDSSNFKALAQDSVARNNFSVNLLNLLQQFNFSGIDIDWEYPDASDADNFVTLLKTIRETLDKSGQKFELSIATGAGLDKINAIGHRWPEIAKYVDHMNLMNYDYNGPWESISDYQSPFSLPPNDPLGTSNSINATLTAYQEFGFPKNKIVLGIPANFRGVKVKSINNFGLWQSTDGAPYGQFDNSGVFDYACVEAKNCYSGNALPSDCQYLDIQHAPYGNFSRTPLVTCPQSLAIFSGDSTESVATKTCYAKQENLNGVFFWAISGDVRNDDNKSLLSTAAKTLKSSACTQVNENKPDTNQVVVLENDWSKFTEHFQPLLVQSFLGGALFTVLFKMVDNITDAILVRLSKDLNLPHLKGESELYLAIKTLVYLATVYTIGLPLLPAAVGKFVSHALQHLLGYAKENAQVVGALTSIGGNLKIDDVTSVQGLTKLVTTLAAATAGAVVVQVSPNLLARTVGYACSFFKPSVHAANIEECSELGIHSRDPSL